VTVGRTAGLWREKYFRGKRQGQVGAGNRLAASGKKRRSVRYKHNVFKKKRNSEFANNGEGKLELTTPKIES